MAPLVAGAFAYQFASRLAYVGWVGVVLTRRRRGIMRAESAGDAFERFRKTASWLMANDAASFVLLCLVSRQTLTIGISRSVLIAIAVLLIATGIGTKIWARETLGKNAYYWHDFFVPVSSARVAATGPYRFLQNPMYTVGYLQAYGAALLVASLPGLIAAVIAQSAILLFHHLVEKPQYEARFATASPASSSRSTTD